MATISVNSFTPGTVISSVDMNANFTTIVNAINGGIDTINLTDGAVTTNKLDDLAVTNSKVAAAANIDASKLGTGVVSTTEFNYLNGVTSAIQTQLDAKAATSGYTASRALQTSGAGALEVSTVTTTELGYLSGVTSALQTQLDAKLPLSGGQMTGNLGLGDSDIIQLGTGDDFEIFTDGTHAYMDLNSGIGNLYIRDGTTTRFTFDDAGAFTATGDITAFSDARVKTDIVTIPDPVDLVNQMRGVFFFRTDMDLEPGVGVIAQEMEQVLPEVVHTGEDGMKSVAYGNIVGVLIEAVKELSARVAELEG